MSIQIAKPSGALKWALHLPVQLYHAGLGTLLGHRFMLLTHRGRKSGRIYETVVEVPVYDRDKQRAFVLSGWGDKADWYRNVAAHPALQVRIGRQCYTPAQHFLTRQETARFWAIFRHKHPVEEWLALRLYSLGGRGKSSKELRAELVGNMRVVCFWPSDAKDR